MKLKVLPWLAGESAFEGPFVTLVHKEKKVSAVMLLSASPLSELAAVHAQDQGFC